MARKITSGKTRKNRNGINRAVLALVCPCVAGVCRTGCGVCVARLLALYGGVCGVYVIPCNSGGVCVLWALSIHSISDNNSNAGALLCALSVGGMRGMYGRIYGALLCARGMACSIIRSNGGALLLCAAWACSRTLCGMPAGYIGGVVSRAELALSAPAQTKKDLIEGALSRCVVMRRGCKQTCASW